MPDLPSHQKVPSEPTDEPASQKAEGAALTDSVLTGGTTPSGSIKLKKRLSYIDALRATAALLVFLVHIYAYWLGSPIQEAHSFSAKGFLIRFISLGTTGVDLFIVISGFSLAYPLFIGTDRHDPPRSLYTLKFYKRRAFRILPAYYLALIIVFVVELFPLLQPYLVARPVNVLDLAAYLLLVETWFNNIVGTIDGSWWSIALEVQLYLAYPLLIAWIRRYGLLKVEILLMFISALWFGVGHFWDMLPISQAIGHSEQFQLPGRWLEFGLGVCAARMVSSPIARDKMIAVLAVCVGAPVGLASESLNSNLGRAFGWGLLAFGVVVLSSYLPNALFTKNYIGRGLVKLGIVSYSFYLLHQPILLLLHPIVRSLGVSQIATIAIGLTAGIGITTLFAVTFFRLIERPFLIRGGMRDAIVKSNID